MEEFYEPMIPKPKRICRECCTPCDMTACPSPEPYNPIRPFSDEEVEEMMKLKHCVPPPSVNCEECMQSLIQDQQDPIRNLIQSDPDPIRNLIQADRDTIKLNDDKELDDESWVSAPPPPLPPPPVNPTGNLIQRTPAFTKTSSLSVAQKMVTECALNLMGPGVLPDRTAPTVGNLGHDPRGIRFGFKGDVVPTETDWLSSKWDGTPYNYIGKSKEDIWRWLIPVGNNLGGILRGVEDLYYSKSPPPFADKYQPTVPEIDAWNIEIVNHIRSMLGISEKVIPDARLYLECQWADERKLTTYWDTKYPTGIIGGSYGPCVVNGIPGKGHCGASFFPDKQDRDEYISQPPYNNDFSKYPELQNYTDRFSKSEGLGGTNARTPWSMRLAMIITNYILGEGTTGHAGPPLFRNRVGFSWACTPGGQIDGGGISFRGKWR